MARFAKSLCACVLCLGLASCMTGLANGMQLTAYLLLGRTDEAEFRMPEELCRNMQSSSRCTLCMDLSPVCRTTEFLTAPLFPATFAVGSTLAITGITIYYGVAGVVALGEAIFSPGETDTPATPPAGAQPTPPANAQPDPPKKKVIQSLRQILGN